MSYADFDYSPEWAKIEPPENFNKIWRNVLEKQKKGWKKIPRMRNLFKKQNMVNHVIVGLYLNPAHNDECKCWRCVEERKGINIFKMRLEKHGFRRIGRGFYSAVYAKPDGNRVIKITKAEDNWYDYVSWARESGWAGKFAPMVYAYKKVTFKGDKFYIASMERMSTVLGSLRERDAPHLLPPLISYHMAGNPLATSMISNYNADLARFLTDFKEKFQNESRFDLHGGNMMLREDQSFCLIDPICGETKTEYRRLRERELSRTLENYLRGLFEGYI